MPLNSNSPSGRWGVHSTRFLGFSASLRLLKAYPQTGVLFNAALAAAGGVHSTFFGSGGSTHCVRLPPTGKLTGGGCIAPVSRAAQLRLLKAYPQTGVLFNAALAAAGAFLRHIGLMRLIGQRLTEWLTFFQIVFSWCGSRPPVLRIKKNPSDYASSVSHRSQMSHLSHLSSRK